MSEDTMMRIVVLEFVGLVGWFVLARRNRARRGAGKKVSPPVRIATSLLGLFVVIGFPALMIVSIVGRGQQNERLREELAERGTAATATITGVQETGTVINREPEIRVLLNIEPEDGPAFSSQATWAFTVSDIQSYRVGTRVRVLFDPQEPGVVAVVGVAPPP